MYALVCSGFVLCVAACSGDAGGATSASSPAAQAGATATGTTASPAAAGASGGTAVPAAMASGAGRPAQAPAMMSSAGSNAAAKPATAGMSSTPGMPATPMSTTPTMNPNGMMPKPSMPSGGILPKVDSTDKDGPYKAMSEVSGAFYVYRPVELGKDGVKHPIFIWGTGAGALPERYKEYFPQFATHGIVVVSPNKTDKTGSDMKAAIDWITAQSKDPSSPYYDKVDITRIGMGGHSQGSIATFDAEGMEDRLKTTIHVAGGSFDMRGSSKVKTPTAYICGEADTLALSNCKADFEAVEKQPTFFTVLKGVDHVSCARNGMPGMISWLRWHLAGETERAAEFTGPSGKFHMGIWVSQTKNWNF